MAEKVLKLEKKTRDGSLNLVFMSDAQIRKLNRRYRKKNRPTDVLSFSMKEGGHLGDIAISVDTAARQAKIFGSSPKKELYLYVIHGILHLLDYDDETEKARRLIKRRESEILEAIWNNTP